MEDELGPEDSESQKDTSLSIQAKVRGGVQLGWWLIDDTEVKGENPSVGGVGGVA